MSRTTRLIIAGTSTQYDYSYLHLLLFNIYDLTIIKFQKDEEIKFSEQELKIIRNQIGEEREKIDNEYLILIVFESLEDWVIKPEFTPNIYRLLNTNQSFHAHKIAKQTMYGGSADGQFILNTGLLPISNDAVCYRYPFNRFPSYPKKHSATLLPHPIDVWNQTCMSPAYGYDTTIVHTEEMNFSIAAKLLSEQYDMMQIITLTSHEPFGGKSNISLPKEMPELMAAYIRSVNCTDRYIGIMIDSLAEKGLLENTTIVISGDHTIFHKERRDKFIHYCRSSGKNYGVENAFCPLVIYSRHITKKVEIYDESYQMDVYPTVLNLLGYNNYYWKGFGVNLLDSVSRQNRQISEQDAYILSDKMIRSNFFSNIK